VRSECDDNKEGESSSAPWFPKVLGYKRGSDITEGDTTGGRGCILD
jgi:hypothetical protein